ncbi:hypothetical protein P5G51_000525 [Virgibacillus sp. 179-BFC.A HS]|uniref:Lipoprotein n=1 Tax=Tigheibacillus jepli TaxID=3035914 RepID=A0ABU5CE24_9BACI|nr:hypothetical protein [Virgibacillus sp. 179-BFC.A HS]MDY0404097.1 hypothetical protein [Virgibacillus sp. 179-BFC.A HS]
MYRKITTICLLASLLLLGACSEKASTTDKRIVHNQPKMDQVSRKKQYILKKLLQLSSRKKTQPNCRQIIQHKKKGNSACRSTRWRSET